MRGNLYESVTIPVVDPTNPDTSFLKVMGNVEVTIKLAGTGTLATFYGSRSVADTTVLPNPFVTSTGIVNVYADYGEYDVTFKDKAVPSRFTDQTFGWTVSPMYAVADVKSSVKDLTDDPTGWLICDGRVVQQASYPALYAEIGARYNGTATVSASQFRLPDFRGRTLIGAGAAATGLTARPLNSSGGLETVSLTTAQLATHSHGVTDNGHAHGVSDPGHAHNASASASGDHTHSVGGGTPIYNTGAGGAGTANVQGGSNFTLYRQGLNADAAGNHSHTISIGGAGTGISIQGSGTGVSVQNAGSGSAHENMMPFGVAHWLIKT